MIIQKLSKHIPNSIKRTIRWSLRFPDKLEYLQFHLTDQCNLNCRGCSHFCPISESYYLDIDRHKDDMHKMRKLFSKIKIIRLMGGEPLLHPDPIPFIKTTRDIFPESYLHFTTNGILLPKSSDAFFEACRNTNITIYVTAYPPTYKIIEDLRALCKFN